MDAPMRKRIRGPQEEMLAHLDAALSRLEPKRKLGYRNRDCFDRARDTTADRIKRNHVRELARERKRRWRNAHQPPRHRGKGRARETLLTQIRNTFLLIHVENPA